MLVPFTDESAVARRFEIQPKKGNWAVVERNKFIVHKYLYFF